MSIRKTKRPLFDAVHVVEGLEKADVKWPKGLSQEHFFAVICSLWDEGEKEFSQPKLNSEGTRIFKEFADAVEYFHKSKYQDFMENIGHEIEIMLIQYNRANGKVMHSKILFP